MRVSNGILFTQSTPAGTAFTTPAFSIQHFTGYSITAEVTSATGLDGYMTLEASNTPADGLLREPPAGAHWVTITLPVDSTRRIQSNGNNVWNYSNAFYRWVRLRWAPISGTCAVRVIVNGKGV